MGDPPELLGSEPIKLLLVENDPHHAARVLALLGAEPGPGFQVTQAHQVEEALRILHDEEHAAVLLDLTLPEGDGLETLSRAKIATRTVPIVVMTDDGDELQALRALRLGAQDYFVRSSSDASLLARVLRRAVERHRIVTELELGRRRDHFLATHDGLTGLPNRFAFIEHLQRAVASAVRHARTGAILFLDLDGFKRVNDTLGHAAGDQCLVAVARRLVRRVRSSDLVARLGGDEFVVLLPEARDELAAAAVARKLLDEVAQPFVFGGSERWLRASIGISLFPRDTVDPELLMHHADAAMYRAKLEARGFRFHSSETNERVDRRLEIEAELAQALARDELVLEYQPRVDLAHGRVIGCEALPLWRHPTRGPLAAGAFLPFAEESGLVIPIGEWALRRAWEENQRWSRATGRGLELAWRVSSQQLSHPRFADFVAGLLRETDLDPALLALELRPAAALRERGASLATLPALRRLGVHVAIANLGAGSSDLTPLRDLPIDGIAIDRTLIERLPEPWEAAMVRALVGLARELGLAATADGVEREEQRDLLLSEGCTRMQGSLFGSPMSYRAFGELLETGRLPPPG